MISFKFPRLINPYNLLALLMVLTMYSNKLFLFIRDVCFVSHLFPYSMGPLLLHHSSHLYRPFLFLFFNLNLWNIHSFHIILDNLVKASQQFQIFLWQFDENVQPLSEYKSVKQIELIKINLILKCETGPL